MSDPHDRGRGDSRRAFLGRAAVAALAGAAARPAVAAAAPVDLVDAHVHVWSPDTARHPLAPGHTVAEMQPPSFTPEELLAACRPHGVARIVLIQMSFYGTDNAYMLAAMKARPGVFGGVAVVDHARGDVAATMRELAAAGVRGFRLVTGAGTAAEWDRSPGSDAMWRCGADESLAMCLLADPEALPAIRDRCRRFPRTPVVIDHFARIGMRGPIAEADIANLLALAELPNTAVKLSAFYALGAKQPPYDDLAPLVRRLRDAFGADRLMWATDCPYQLAAGQGYGPSVELVRDRLDFLSADERTKILRDTATRIFFRGLPAPG